MSTKEESALELYNHSKYMKYGSLLAFAFMLSVAAYFYYVVDEIAMMLTFVVCSFMFLGMSILTHVMMKYYKPLITPHLPKTK